jgi:S-adenosylmethionine-diacylglycerol 3-amino-3-carboxypropyl transferase
LREENFARLKSGQVDCIRAHTSSILDFLRRYQGNPSRFVLLDHMDWLSTSGDPVLREQWQMILSKAAPGARLLWRSGGLSVDYVDPIEVELRGRRRRVGEVLRYHHDLASKLHACDRVHTYGSFYVADLAA